MAGKVYLATISIFSEKDTEDIEKALEETLSGLISWGHIDIQEAEIIPKEVTR